MPSLEMRRISCLLRLSLLPEMEQRVRIFISETQRLPLCLDLPLQVSGNRLVCIVACDRATVLAKPSPQTSSSFSNVKHATSTA